MESRKEPKSALDSYMLCLSTNAAIKVLIN